MRPAPGFEQLEEDPSSAYPREVWAESRPTERAVAIRQRLLETAREIDLDRARYTTESYQRSEGQPMPIRRAMMLRDVVRHLSITIQPDELIVGNRSYLPRMGVIAPEGAVDWVDRELEDLPTRPQDRFSIRPEQIRELREEIFPYWRGKTLEDAIASRLPPDVRAAVRGRAFGLNQTDHAQGHILPDVESWLRLGLGGLRERVIAASNRPEAQTDQHRIFYRAGLIAIEAARDLIERYAALARTNAAATENPIRRQELLRIAGVCGWIAEYPPRDTWEALQSLWFLFVLLQIESNASSFSPGRFDQYMLRYFERDLATGSLSFPEAQALLELMWLKFNEIVLLRSGASARYFAGFPIGFNIVLGGQVSDGICARAAGRMRRTF